MGKLNDLDEQPSTLLSLCAPDDESEGTAGGTRAPLCPVIFTLCKCGIRMKWKQLFLGLNKIKPVSMPEASMFSFTLSV